MSTQTTGRDALQMTGCAAVGNWCKLTPNAGAAPTVVSNFGFTSITRSGTGVTVFTHERINEPALPVITYQQSDALDHVFVVSAVTSTGFTITHMTAARGAALAAADNTGLTAFGVQMVGEQN